MCGIFGIADHPEAADLAYLGLFALQHRGQESAGIVTAHQGQLFAQTGMGLVSEVFNRPALACLPGRSAVGHVRYSTTGASHLKNAQPLVFNCNHGTVAIAHNGNLTNARETRERLERKGAIFQSSTDSEVIVHLLARRLGAVEAGGRASRPPSARALAAGGAVEGALMESLGRLDGSYCLLVLTPEKLIAARDPQGFRPLVLGKLDGAFVVASETTALNLVKAKTVREIEPGEVVVIEAGNLRSFKASKKPAESARCVFEHVYFARPDSMVFGRNVQSVRRELGRALAREMARVKADMVVPVPDSGLPAALGFSDESGIPFEMALVRSHYVSRTFIRPTQELREVAAHLKLAPVPEILKGRRIVLIDDSIVRGTTSRKITRSLREAGAKEIHMAISSPPIVSPCYYGIDTPRSGELIANRHSLAEIKNFLEVDSLHYLSLSAMLNAAGGGDPRGFCGACFTGVYPTRTRDFRAAFPFGSKRHARASPWACAQGRFGKEGTIRTRNAGRGQDALKAEP
ncbi:MAG: amidophosphoribosyltransferase [Elusimicrobia bacterium]|nr:amidophosphoribosyltransferase [Elusimicrobiota bacterium]